MPVTASFLYNWLSGSLQSASANFSKLSYVNPGNFRRPISNDSIMKFNFQLGNLLEIQNWGRDTLLDYILAFGGANALITPAFAALVAIYSNFSLNNSMMRSIYTEPAENDKNRRKVETSLNKDDSESLLKSE